MDRAAVMAWRKTERERLIKARMALAVAERAEMSAEIIRRLDERLHPIAGRRISFYWPFRGEPDLRPLATRLHESGGTALLPVVVGKGRPMIFRPWIPGGPLTPGVWNIPVPDTEQEDIPEVVVSPVVGFDGQNYRLGYGGGFYDRTLADFTVRPLVIGVGYAVQRLDTIHPLAHDIAMDEIIAPATP